MSVALCPPHFDQRKGGLFGSSDRGNELASYNQKNRRPQHKAKGSKESALGGQDRTNVKGPVSFFVGEGHASGEVERDRGWLMKEAMTKKSSSIFSDEVKGDHGEQSFDLEAPLEDACRSRPIDQSAVASMVPDREQTSGTKPPPLPWYLRRRSIWLDVKVSAGHSTLMVQDPRFGGRAQSPRFPPPSSRWCIPGPK